MSGWEEERGGKSGVERSPQVKTRGPEFPTDGLDHATQTKVHHSGQG